MPCSREQTASTFLVKGGKLWWLVALFGWFWWTGMCLLFYLVANGWFHTTVLEMPVHALHA